MKIDPPIPEYSLYPVTPTRVYGQIVQQIRDLISEGNLKAGDRLPPERELAERFQVSRNSVRAAIRTLETLGLVETRQGDGTYICHNKLAALPDTLSLALASKREAIKEIMVLRKIFEPGVAYYAAQQVTPEDILELENILERHELKAAQNDPGTEEDEQFHHKIAQMTRNSIVLEVIETINDVVKESRDLLLRYQNNAMRTGHRKLLTALKAKDADAASRAMLAHIEEVETAFNEVLGNRYG